MTATTTKLDLSQFIGTETYYKYPFSKIVYTDGIKYVCDEAQAYWLLDECVLNFAHNFKDQPFLSITLTVKDGSGDSLVTDGNDTVLGKAHYAYTDFPQGTYRFYLTDGVLMLASEY